MARSHQLRRLGWITGLVAASLLSACATTPAGPSSLVPNATTSATPSVTPSSSPTPIETNRPSATETTRTTTDVEVGGLSISVTCQGVDGGAPTIVLMHGNGSGGQGQFDRVTSELLAQSRVCSYNRPGTGSTAPPAILPRPITDVVAEAHGVLQAAGIRGPVLLLGTSEGAAIAFMYAQAHPEGVVGFVAINPNPPYSQWLEEAAKVETAEELEIYEEPDYRGENPERIDNRPNSSMLTDPLPDAMLYAVMFDDDCGGDTTFCAKVFAPLAAMGVRLAAVGAGGRYVAVPGAGHSIELTNPNAVIRVVQDVLAEATE